MTLLLLLRPSFGATGPAPADNPSAGGGNPDQLLTDPFRDPFATDPFATDPFRRDLFLPTRRRK